MIAIIIMIIAVWILMSRETVIKPLQSTLLPTDRPNKFISDGDSIDCGEYTLTKFATSFEVKINLPDIVLISFTDSKQTNSLTLTRDKLTFNDKTMSLDFSPFTVYEWVHFYIYADKNWTVVVNSKSYDFGAVKSTEANNVIIGGANQTLGFFSGAIANIKINGNYMYRLVNGGVNQKTKKTLSVAGFSDLGLFGSREAYETIKTVDNTSSIQAPKTFPVFKIAPFVVFTLNAELRIFKDDVFLEIKDRKTENKISVGKKQNTNNTDDNINIPFHIEYLDYISINLSRENVVCKNITSGLEYEYKFTKPINFKEFDVYTQSTASCILSKLNQGERVIWFTGENFIEQENHYVILNNIDLTNSIVKIPTMTNIKDKWICSFNLQLKNTDKITFLGLENKRDKFVMSVNQKKLTLSATVNGKTETWSIDAPTNFSTGTCKFVIKYDSNLSVIFLQNTEAPKQFLKFLPSLYKIFSGSHFLYLGSLNDNLGFGDGSIYYGNFTLNGVALKHIPNVSMERQPKNMMSCIVSTTFHNTVCKRSQINLFTVKLNKSIGVVVQDGNLYTVIDSKKIYMGHLPNNVKFRVGLKFDKIFTLFIIDDMDRISTYKFNPQITNTNLIGITFPDPSVEMFKAFGQICVI